MNKYFLLCLSTLAILLIWFVFKSYTPPVWTKNPVAELVETSVNDDRQWLLKRGCDRQNPLILFLHGGPGMPAMFTAHRFQRALERHFVIIHWDQRGAGKSFHAGLNPKTMTISQLIRDAEVVIEKLLTEFDQEKLIIVGHSHGTYLGGLLAQHRPDLIHAYIGLGQIGDPAREHEVQNKLIADYFVGKGLQAPLITPENRESLLFKIGGELAGFESYWPLLWAGLFAPEYSLADVLNVAKGPGFAQQHLVYDLNTGFGPPPTEFSVPVYVVMGAQDAVTPVELAREWFLKVDATARHWTVMPGAAHFPHFERPDQFNELLLNIFYDSKETGKHKPRIRAWLSLIGLHCLDF